MSYIVNFAQCQQYHISAPASYILLLQPQRSSLYFRGIASKVELPRKLCASQPTTTVLAKSAMPGGAIPDVHVPDRATTLLAQLVMQRAYIKLSCQEISRFLNTSSMSVPLKSIEITRNTKYGSRTRGHSTITEINFSLNCLCNMQPVRWRTKASKAPKLDLLPDPIMEVDIKTHMQRRRTAIKAIIAHTALVGGVVSRVAEVEGAEAEEVLEGLVKMQQCHDSRRSRKCQTPSLTPELSMVVGWQFPHQRAIKVIEV